jgi:hypothetical protein
VRGARPRTGSFATALRRTGAGLLVGFAVMGVTATGAAAETGTTTDRYTVVHGCFALESAGGGLIAQAGDGYAATASSVAEAEAFRLQATDLGKYLFYGEAQDFMGLDEGPIPPPQDEVVVATVPSGRTTWIVEGANGQFTIVSQVGNLGLAVDGSDQLVSVPADQAETFTFVPAPDANCAVYPEIALNATGDPNTNTPRHGEVEGTVDAHMHMMAFEFLGGHAHCGEPWHKFGAPYALKDCEDHEANSCSAVLETALKGDPCHETGGWPDFAGWPESYSLTHESSYYRWLERAHLAGLRVFVNLMVENRVLCEIYPDMSVVQGEPKSNCDEMDSVRREIQRIEQLEDYIDAQAGGPGEGFFRIVESPFQARKAINRGKLAVIKGMEVSEPFDCGYKGVLDGPASPVPDSRCSEDHIDDVLNELWDLGVRQMEITNKFDNQLTGVAGDGGDTGIVVNTGQFGTSGSFWEFGPENDDPGSCDDHNHDRVPGTGGTPVSQDGIFGAGLDAFLGPALNGIPILIPTYTSEQVCNMKGLQDGDPPQNDQPQETNFGAHALNGIMDHGFVFDPDHMSVIARDEALDMLEAADYPGIISSHSWSTQNTLPRVYALGGIVTPYAGGSSGFANEWEQLKSAEVRGELGDQYFGLGYGADANGFGSQGGPRNPAEEADVDYPFTGIDGAVTFDQQMSGTDAEGRTYDINVDGVDHYGLYADWMEDLRQIKGDEIVNDMNRGAEAYLQMWERTFGIGEVDCSQWGDEDWVPKGLGTELRLNRKPKTTLRSAGQPVDRFKVWRWCAAGGGRDSETNVWAAFGKRSKMNFALSNVPQHDVEGTGPGDPRKSIPKSATKISDRVWLSRTGGRRAFAWVAAGGTVTHTGAVSQTAAQRPNKLARRIVRVASS